MDFIPFLKPKFFVEVLIEYSGEYLFPKILSDNYAINKHIFVT